MATTSNFGWPTPDDSDAVSQGAAAIRSLGSAIDATVAAGYRYAGTRYYTSSGTFAKADPLGTGDIGLRAVRVRLVGGGGGGGGADLLDRSGGSGGGGGYGEKFITDIASLAASETVTRGAGGAGGAAGDNAGANGGTSSAFSVSATGGTGGQASNGSFGYAAGGTATGADLSIAGSNGMTRFASPAANPPTTASFFAPTRPGSPALSQSNGASGLLYGGGGAGGVDAGSAASGGNGGNGIVIIDCYV